MTSIVPFLKIIISKAESTKSKLDQSYLLLANQRINQKKSNYIPNHQNMEDSEYTTEYILNIPDDQSEKANKLKTQINTKQTIISTKSEQPKNELKLTKSPNKSRQQSSNNNNRQKILEESESAAVYVLEAPDDSSAKAIFTKRFSAQSKQPEKANPIKTPSSSLSNPSPTKNQSINKYIIDKSEIESKHKQETLDRQSGKAAITKRFVLADDQPQRNIQSKAQSNKASISSLTNPNKNQSPQNMKCNQINLEGSIYVLTMPEEQPEESEITKKFTSHCEQTEKKGISSAFDKQSFRENDQEDAEYSSDCILEELEEEEETENWNESECYEFASSSEMCFNSSQANNLKPKQIEKVESPGSLDKQSTLLNKTKQQTIAKDECQTDIDESEKAIVTEKFLIANIRQQDFINLKKFGIAEQQKSSENKSVEQSNTKRNQKAAEGSEYILKIPEEQIEKHINQSTECNKSNQTEKVEQAKSPIKDHSSFLLNQHKNQSNMKGYRKLTKESEDTSKYILEEPANNRSNMKCSRKPTEGSECILKIPEEQIEKPIVAEKSVNKCTKSNKQEKVEQTKSAIQKPSSLSLHPNKNDEQSKTKYNQKATEGLECILKIPEEQIEKPIVAEKSINKCTKSNQPEKVEQSKSPIKNHSSFLLHQRQNQSNMRCYRKLTNESEDTSEYILEEPANDKLGKNVATKKLTLSSNQKQETFEQQKPSEKTSLSISAHPNKNSEQLNTKCSQKETEESEYESEKTVITQKFLLCNLKAQQDLLKSSSQADENIEPSIPSKFSYSHQVSPNKIDNKPVNKHNEEIIMKLQLNKVENEPTKYAINKTKNQVSSPPKNQVVNEPKKVFVNEAKNQIVNMSKNQIGSEQTNKVSNDPKSKVFNEQKNQDVGEQNKTQLKKKPFLSTYDRSIFYNDSDDVTSTFDFLNQPISDNADASTLDKSSQFSFIKINKANIDESECTSEYILKMASEQPEKVTATEKSNNHNIKSKQQEKASPSKSPVKKPDSPLSHPNKSRQPTFRKNNQASIKESENACEYRIELPDEQPEIEEPSKSPTKKIDSLTIQAEKNIKQSNQKRNQKPVEEFECASEYILKVPNEQQEKVTLAEKFILPIDQTKENTKPKQPEKLEQSKSPTKKTNSFHIKPENNKKESLIKRNQKSEEESEYASKYILKLPNEQQEKETLIEKFILPNNQIKESTKPKQPEKLEQSKSPIKTPCSLPIQTEKSRKSSDIKRNQKAKDESELASEFVLVIPEEQFAKEDTNKQFILPIDQELQNKVSKQPKSSNKDSHSPLILQNKSKQQEITKRNQKNQEDCVYECILEIPEEQTEKAIDTKKSTLSKSQAILLSINSAKDPLQMKQNKSEISAQLNQLNEKAKKETYKVEPTKSFSRTNIKQQPINQEPPISPQSHLAELEEQIEKWWRSDYLEFASSSEKIFNSSISSINQRLTQAEKTEQIRVPATPSCSLMESPNETRLQETAKDGNLLPETTEESYSEKTIVTPKFLLCNLKTKINSSTQTDETIEPVIPSKKSCSNLVLQSNECNDGQCFKINFLSPSEYDDEIEPETFKKETEKCQIKTSTPRNQVFNEQNNLIKTKKNQVINEPKNQIIKTQKNQVFNDKNNLIKTKKNQVINEPKNQIIKTQKNKVFKEQNNLIKTKNNQYANEERKKQRQKKQKPFFSTYDRSIFYNDSNDIPKSPFEFQEPHHTKNNVVSPAPDQMPLTVSLKDIGLEGFDSNSIETINEMKDKSRILIHVDVLSEKNRDKIGQNQKSEVICKLSPGERKDKLISSIKKVEYIDPYFALLSSSDEKNYVAGSNLKPASLLDSTQKAQKIQAIKPKSPSKNCSKTSKSFSFNSSYDEYQFTNIVCRSPRRFKSPNNDY